MKQRVLWSDGRRWYVRRSKASTAFLERINQHQAKGWLTPEGQTGDVSLYRIGKDAPFFDERVTADELRAMIDECVDLAANRDWDEVYAATQAIAHTAKAEGVGRSEFDRLMVVISQRASMKANDPNIPLHMREAMRARSWADKPIVVMG